MALLPGTVQRAFAHPRRRLPTAVILIGAMVATFLVVATLGARQADHDERVLSVLDPLLGLVRTKGRQSVLWLLEKSAPIGWGITVVSTSIAVVALIVARLRAAPVALLAAVVSLAAWGQISILADGATLGAWFYVLGMLGSVALGFWCPMSSLAGFPELPHINSPQRTKRARRSISPGGAPTEPSSEHEPAMDADSDRGRREDSAKRQQARAASTSPTHFLSRGRECLLLFLLVLAGLLARIYALTELPQAFDLELIAFQVQSRTAHGLMQYIGEGSLLSNGSGAVTQLSQLALFHIFGTSVYTLRLTAVLWGTAAIPLLYWLARRIAGSAAAVVSTVLFVVAPDQLFWSRTENTHFSAMAALALVTAQLGLWMVERFSIVAVLSAALWMPFCRYFYTPGLIMFVYPFTLYSHAAVFVRGAWRKAWYVVPLLCGGLVLFLSSYSILYAYTHNWEWRFINPILVRGAAPWRKDLEGPFRSATLTQLIPMQLTLVTNSLREVIEGFTNDGPRMFSHWYARAVVSPKHRLVMNPGVVVTLAVGLGYLLGQFWDRRAFMLLAWVALGLFPGLMSDQPSPRRLSLAFPAFYIIAGLALTMVTRVVRRHTGSLLAWMTTAGLGVAVAAIVCTSLISHFLLEIGPVPWSGDMRFAKPLFEESDTIFTDLDIKSRLGVLFGNLDRFLQSPPCYQYAGPTEWLRVALQPHCDFRDPAYPFTMPPERIESLRKTYSPQRISYLFNDRPSNLPHVDLLRALFPASQVRQFASRPLISLTVDISAIRAARAPSVMESPPQSDPTAVATGLLAGVTLTTAAPGTPTTEGLTARGGVLVERDGWYRFSIEPPCPQATFAIDGQAVDSSAERPISAGVHPFELTLPNPTACSLPLHLFTRAGDGSQPVSLADMLVSPFVASLPEAQPRPVVAYEGYGQAQQVARLQGPPVALGVDGEGHITVLVGQPGSWRVQRFSPDGQEEANWRPQFAADAFPPEEMMMAVGSDGTCVISTGSTVSLYDRTGMPIRTWENPFGDVPFDMTMWRGDQVVMALTNSSSIGVVTRDGQVRGRLQEFAGGRRLAHPMAVAVSPGDDFFVLQEDGQGLLFHNAGDQWNPVFVRLWRIDFESLDFRPRGCAFDGTDRLLVPDLFRNKTLMYTPRAERLMAATRTRDLNAKGFSSPVGFYATADRLYVLDRSAPYHLWAVSR